MYTRRVLDVVPKRTKRTAISALSSTQSRALKRTSTKRSTVAGGNHIVPSTSIRTAASVPHVHLAGKLAFDASKAGLQSVDKEHVQRVIEDASKGSPFYLKERKREAEREEKNREIIDKACIYEALPASQKLEWKAKTEKVEKAIEVSRDFSRCFIHVDMDMFYAAVEERREPGLASKPFAVGSYTMLSTSNYVARKFGVRSGMPGFIAKKLCPQLIVVPPHMDEYKAVAEQVRQIGRAYDPRYVAVGLDELTMDITDYLSKKNIKGHRKKSAWEVCEKFRADVLRETGLTCSGGIAHSPALAKLAANMRKPNGQHELALHTRDDVMAYVHSLPVRQIPGVGFAHESTLNALGIHTCGDILPNKDLLCYLFKEKTFTTYLSAGLGLLRSHVDRTLSAGGTQQQRKSISKEKTFSRRIKSEDAMRDALLKLASDAHDELLQERASARCVVVYTKDCSFENSSYSVTLSSPTNDFETILDAVKSLVEPHLCKYSSLRLVGVGFNKLAPLSARARRTSASTAAASVTSKRSVKTDRKEKRNAAIIVAAAAAAAATATATTTTTVRRGASAATRIKRLASRAKLEGTTNKSKAQRTQHL